jgi:cation diffusion facilitator CzcD-associated flavoprotein CzcO
VRRTFRHVIVGTGMFWEPVFPRLEGDFEGGVMHSLEYRDPAVLHGKRVLVIGAGPSGVNHIHMWTKRIEHFTMSLVKVD